MKGEYQISVLMAVYNGAQWLSAAIESVLEQNYPFAEFVIIDDGSTDNTSEIVRQYQR